MKATYFIYLIFSLCFFQPVFGWSGIPGFSTETEPITTGDSLLYGIQDRINRKFMNSMARSQVAPIEQLSEQLAAGYQRTDQPLYRYWQAYTLFYTSIFWVEQGEEKKAERATDRAISLLKDQSRKTTEDYALLAFLQGFSISFKAGIRAPFIWVHVQSDPRILAGTGRNKGCPDPRFKGD
jgi:hypothetical protein